VLVAELTSSLSWTVGGNSATAVLGTSPSCPVTQTNTGGKQAALPNGESAPIYDDPGSGITDTELTPSGVAAGTLDGTFHVTHDGLAAYSIPIDALGPSSGKRVGPPLLGRAGRRDPPVWDRSPATGDRTARRCILNPSIISIASPSDFVSLLTPRGLGPCAKRFLWALKRAMSTQRKGCVIAHPTYHVIRDGTTER
jgi:hypothetical protein